MHEFSSQLSTLFFALSRTAKTPYTNWLIFNWITSFFSPLFNSIWVLRAGLDEIFFASLLFWTWHKNCLLFSSFAFHDISQYFQPSWKTRPTRFTLQSRLRTFPSFHIEFSSSHSNFTTTRSFDVCGKAWILSESRKNPLSQERKNSLRSFASASHQQRINSFHFESNPNWLNLHQDFIFHFLRVAERKGGVFLFFLVFASGLIYW